MKDSVNDSWVLIPPTILGDNRLSLGEKVVYGKVLGLTKSRGYCYASNEYLAQAVGLSKNSIRNYLSKLYRLDYLRHELKRDPKTKEVIERHIYATLVPYKVLPSTTPSTLFSTKSLKEEDKEEVILAEEKYAKLKAEIYKKVGKPIR